MNVPTVTEVPAGAFLLDVRELDEWQAGHAPDATHIPLSDVPGRVAELPADRLIVAICRVGGRSGRATAYLRAQGLDVHNYEGGMREWAGKGGELVTDSGAQPTVI